MNARNLTARSMLPTQPRGRWQAADLRPGRVAWRLPISSFPRWAFLTSHFRPLPVGKIPTNRSTRPPPNVSRAKPQTTCISPNRNRSHEVSRRYIFVGESRVTTLWMSSFDELSLGSTLMWSEPAPADCAAKPRTKKIIIVSSSTRRTSAPLSLSLSDTSHTASAATVPSCIAPELRVQVLDQPATHDWIGLQVV
jgi:hypothetical protein